MDSFEQQVQQIFAELTRYPLDVLDPAADLEEDLGIDSVKRGEILAAFQERFDLPETLDIPPEQLSTIAGIAAVIRTLKEDGVPPPAAAVLSVVTTANGGEHGAAPGNGNGAAHGNGTANGKAHGWSEADLERIVVETLAEVTRYPRDILTSDAHLEDDLGIDSVKRGEILTVLRERLALTDVDAPVEMEIDTVGDIVAAALLLVGGAPAPEVVEKPAVRSAPVVPQGRRSFLTTAAPFADKVALVTGSGHGIGRAIACQLGDLGATVVVNSFHSRERGEETLAAIRDAGGRGEHVWASVANPVQVDRLFAEIETRFGHLDFLVCNASNGMIAPLKDITESHWERAFRTNVVGLHQAAMRAAPLMRRRGGGKIVTLSSPGAQRYIEYFGCMGPAKAALESLTRYLAVELAPDNIQVNAVSAGPIYGELLSRYPDSARLIPYWESLSAGRRLGEESDVASFVAYLLSEAANKITGSVLLVDSGGSQRI
jgi:enoyl-[acyl-carrier protein] reductase III